MLDPGFDTVDRAVRANVANHSIRLAGRRLLGRTPRQHLYVMPSTFRERSVALRAAAPRRNPTASSRFGAAAPAGRVVWSDALVEDARLRRRTTRNCRWQRFTRGTGGWDGEVDGARVIR